MKYKNYKELKAAYDSGELDRTKHFLMLDNDDCHVFVGDKQVFQGSGYGDLEELAELAGLPTEWV